MRPVLLTPFISSALSCPVPWSRGPVVPGNQLSGWGGSRWQEAPGRAAGGGQGTSGGGLLAGQVAQVLHSPSLCLCSQVLWSQEPKACGDRPSEKHPRPAAVLLPVLGPPPQHREPPPVPEARPRGLQVSWISSVTSAGHGQWLVGYLACVDIFGQSPGLEPCGRWKL